MTVDDVPASSTPSEHATALSRSLLNNGGVNSVTESAGEDGAIVTCYAYRDAASEVEELATNTGFDVLHSHQVQDEVHYVFGYTEQKEKSQGD